jgi:hypothetical protein
MSDREAARELIRELLHEALAVPDGDGATPSVPPPPVAAVHRPSTWTAPPAEPGIEHVRIESDDDLDGFVRGLLARFENPREREAIQAGRLRFGLERAGAAAAGTIRIPRGAVTERKVEEAARTGARLLLGRGAVLTPLAREKARAKGIAIERER